MENMEDDKEILKELRKITKNKENWNIVIDEVATKLNGNYSVDVKSKVLWLIGEMGLNNPVKIKKYVDDIATYLKDDSPKLKERSVNALRRIGRADENLIIPFFDKIKKMKENEVEKVRLFCMGLRKYCD